MTPTKIKARKMYATPDYFRLSHIADEVFYTNPVYVLDASRYEEMVEQMTREICKSHGFAWRDALDGWKTSYRADARAALRSIGITKGAK